MLQEAPGLAGHDQLLVGRDDQHLDTGGGRADLALDGADGADLVDSAALRGLGSDQTPVLVNGKRARVVGTVTMDMTMVDVTGIPCERGDVATLIGADGEEAITAADVGAACGLSPYEILTSLRARPHRSYR